MSYVSQCILSLMGHYTFCWQYYLYSCMLALISCSVFLRISYLVKMGYMLVCLCLCNIMFYEVFYHVFEIYDTYIQWVMASEVLL